MPPKRKTAERKVKEDTRDTMAALKEVYTDDTFDELAKLRKTYVDHVKNIMEQGKQRLREIATEYTDACSAALVRFASIVPMGRDDVSRLFNLEFSFEDEQTVFTPFKPEVTDKSNRYDFTARITERILYPSEAILLKYQLITSHDAYDRVDLVLRFPFLLVMEVMSPVHDQPMLAVATRSPTTTRLRIRRLLHRRNFANTSELNSLYVQLLSKDCPVLYSACKSRPGFMFRPVPWVGGNAGSRERDVIRLCPRFAVPALAAMPAHSTLPKGLAATARLVGWSCRLLRKSVLPHAVVSYIMQFLVGPFVRDAMYSLLTAEAYVQCMGKDLPPL